MIDIFKKRKYTVYNTENEIIGTFKGSSIIKINKEPFYNIQIMEDNSYILSADYDSLLYTENGESILLREVNIKNGDYIKYEEKIFYIHEIYYSIGTIHKKLNRINFIVKETVNNDEYYY